MTGDRFASQAATFAKCLTATCHCIAELMDPFVKVAALCLYMYFLNPMLIMCQDFIRQKYWVEACALSSPHFPAAVGKLGLHSQKKRHAVFMSIWLSKATSDCIVQGAAVVDVVFVCICVALANIASVV